MPRYLPCSVGYLSTVQEFTQSDKLMAHEIQRKTLRLQKLQDAVNNWKLKIAANVRRPPQ